MMLRRGAPGRGLAVWRPLVALGIFGAFAASLAVGPASWSREPGDGRRGGRERRTPTTPTASRDPSRARPIGSPLGSGVYAGDMVVFGYNDLGMHCMNQDFSELCILPPFNNYFAEIIDRSGEHPQIVRGGVTVEYSVPSNTRSSNKTNFWKYAESLFGVKLPPDIGLTGNGLAGRMSPTGDRRFSATGVPITPINDAGQEDAYPLGMITVKQNGRLMARTRAVMPVSWEISCDLCHNTPGMSPDTDILLRHDLKWNTNLVNSKPVLCAGCHADPALGTPKQGNIPSLSAAMHSSHADRMTTNPALENSCYACHPGFRTNCQRDVHFAKGIFCTDCHGEMKAVGNPERTPWQDEPRCETCHAQRKPRFEFEQPGELFRNSKGHQGVHCSSCHGSPHAITPTVTAQDNVQAIGLQGHAGTIDTCTVCHSRKPGDPFKHRWSDDD